MAAVQAYVPRIAWDALDLPLIVKLAKIAGIANVRVEASTVKIPRHITAGSIRITASLEMSLALIEAFRQQAAMAERSHDASLLIATAKAVTALLAAIEEYHHPKGPSGTEPTPY